MTKRLPGNQQIVIADRPADGFHLRAKFTRNAGVFFIKWKVTDRPGKKTSKDLSVNLAAVTF